MNGDFVEKILTGKGLKGASFLERIFGQDGLVEYISINGWDKLLRWSTPVFQLCEGFCSLLVIQAAGQITRWLVNRGGRSDSWMVNGFYTKSQAVANSIVIQITLLVMSASIISSSVYFLWRIAKFPEINNVDAILIGMTVTCAIFLCAWGIGSGKGNPVESSLLFAYVVLCIYQIFTDYQPSNPLESIQAPSEAADFPPFPPIIMASYSTIMYALSQLPSIIHATFNFISAALSTITPSVIISLSYRIFVLYAATRIIPAVRGSGARAFTEDPTLEDSDGVGQLLGLISWFSPSILIAVYTSLLMQHFASTNGDHNGEWWTSQGGNAGGNLWRWLNVVGTMGLYALELYLGKQDIDGELTNGWKAD